jgi:hypothetical protein
MMVAIRIMLYYQRVVGLYYRKAQTLWEQPFQLPASRNLSTSPYAIVTSAASHPDSWVEVLKVQGSELFLTPVQCPRIRGGRRD